MTLAIGMRVSLQEEARRRRNLRETTFIVRGPIVGKGPDTFVKLTGLGGEEVPTWFRCTEFRDPLQEPIDLSTAGGSILANARQLIADHSGKLSLADAIKQAAAAQRLEATRHLATFGATSPSASHDLGVPISLRRDEGESFPDLVERVARERRLEFREAVRLVSLSYPGMARDYVSNR